MSDTFTEPDASAWDESGGVGSGAPERVLNQEEIDSLLGFELNDEEGGERTGVRAIINSALVSYERLPMLEIVFDRLVRLLTTSLRNFTSDNVEVSLDNISSIRFGDYLNSIPMPAILAVFRCEELDNYGLLTVDSNLIYSVVDVLLGGRRGAAAMRIEGRPYTTIERMLVQRMVEVVLNDCRAAFEPLTKVSFNLERLETNPRFAAIGRPANAAILVKLRIDMEDRGGPGGAAAPLCDAGADPQDAAAAVHGRKVRPRPHLGEPPRHRTLDHPGGGARGAGRDADGPAPGAGPEGRRHGDAERHRRQPRAAPRRRGAPDGRTHGPPQPEHRRAGRGAAERGRPQGRRRCTRWRTVSPVAAGLDGLLALLLLLALGLGLKLNTRLKALREGQAGFAAAVIELNQAAARAEAGLEALKLASESAHDDLLTRIETARGLVGRLERAGADAHRILDSLPEGPAAPARLANAVASGGGSLAAIAALAEGRLIERGVAASEPRPAPPAGPRRPARAGIDDDLFETKSREPVPRDPARERGDRLELGPLRPTRGDR